MNTSQTISSQQILSALQVMPLSELERLMGQALAVRAARVAPHLSGEEVKLLQIINKQLPDKSRRRMKELQFARDNETLASDGFAELARLIAKLEELHADRMSAVSALAALRGVTLQTALQQVGLRLPDYE